MTKSRFDSRLIAALACGEDRERASEIAGCSERTLYRRLNDPDFLSKVRQVRQATVTITAGRLQREALQSVMVLAELRDEDESSTVKLRAARALLSLAVSWETIDVADLVAELENRIAAIEKGIAEKDESRIPGVR